MKKNKRRSPTVVDLFCGCGAATEAFSKKEFNVVAAVDNDVTACETYKKNHPTVRLYEKDVRRIDPGEIRKKDLANRNLDVLIVCAPCQPFSSQNKKRGSNDVRSDLLLQGVRFANNLKPKVIVFENVSGLVSSASNNIRERLKRRLFRAGYKLSEPVEVDAANYGVPQRRKRFIFMASRRSDLPHVPRPTTPLGRRRTLKQAIGRLKPLKSGQKDPKDKLHFAREHHQTTLKRLRHIPKNGGSRESLPKHLVLECHKNYGGHPDVYGRMKWSEIAPTLTTGCTDLTRGRFVHPRDDRAITLREAAVLQTFPLAYKFVGNSSQIATQIGNAVPVRLFKAIAHEIKKVLTS